MHRLRHPLQLRGSLSRHRGRRGLGRFGCFGWGRFGVGSVRPAGLGKRLRGFRAALDGESRLEADSWIGPSAVGCCRIARRWAGPAGTRMAGGVAAGARSKSAVGGTESPAGGMEPAVDEATAAKGRGVGCTTAHIAVAGGTGSVSAADSSGLGKRPVAGMTAAPRGCSSLALTFLRVDCRRDEDLSCIERAKFRDGGGAGPVINSVNKPRR